MPSTSEASRVSQQREHFHPSSESRLFWCALRVILHLSIMGTLALHVVSSRGLLLSRLAPLHCSRLQRTSLLRISSRCHSSLVRVVERDDKDDTENEEWLTLKAQHQHAPLTCNNASSLRQASAAVDTSTTSTSPSELVYTGNHRIPVTSHLHIVTPSEDVPRGVWPIFRLMVC